MKHCIQCGGDYPDHLTACPLDRSPLLGEPPARVVVPPLPPRHGIDVSPIAAEVCRVRADYVAALSTRKRRSDNGARLVRAFRRIVGHLSFFQSAGSRVKREHDL